MNDKIKLLSLIILVSVFSCSSTQDADKVLSEARNKMKSQAYKEAQSLLDGLIDADPQNTEALNMRGVAHVNLESYGKALSDFNAAIEQNDRNYMFFYNRGNVKRKLKQPGGAVEDYTKAISLDSTHYQIWLNRALANIGKGDSDTAAQDFEKALETGGDKDPEVFFYKGRLHIGQGDFQKGLDAATKCIGLNDKHGPGHYMMALGLLGVGSDVAEACDHAQTSVSLGYQPAQDFIAQYCGGIAPDSGDHSGHNH